jgi:hypothetical protein
MFFVVCNLNPTIMKHLVFVLKLTSFFLYVLLPIFGYSQVPSIEWSRCYGGSRDEGINIGINNKLIVPTPDGGYLIAAQTQSIDGDIDIKQRHDDLISRDSFSTDDIWLIKISADGVRQWERCYGGDNNEAITHISPTRDGGYIACGYTSSITGDFFFDTTNRIDVWIQGGTSDGFVMKLDSLGKKEWISRIGGSSKWGDNIHSVIETTDGGFIAAGYTYSYDEEWLDLPWPNHPIKFTDTDIRYFTDGFVVKLDPNGKKLWNRLYGGSWFETFYDLIETPEGTFLLCGGTNSDDGDITKIHYRDSINQIGITTDLWLVEIDNNGFKLWDRCYGGTGQENGLRIIRSNENDGYIIAGQTTSLDGDVVGYHPNISRDKADIWLFKIDSSRNIIWQNCLGGSSDDIICQLIPLSNNGYACIGSTFSIDGDIVGLHRSGNVDSLDIWVAELSQNGSLVWQKCLGGTANDNGKSILQTSDGLLVFGVVGSVNGDIIGNHGGSIYHNSDIWVAKLKTNQNAVEASSESHFANPYPNPSGDEVSLRIHPTIAPQSVKFFNLLGQEFTPTYKLDGNLLTASITSLPKGMYIIRITYPTGFQETRKFVKAN